MTLIEVNNITHSFEKEASFKLTIDQLSLSKNNTLFIKGPSGSGKTTFLNILTGLLQPNEGTITVCGTKITNLNPIQADLFRADHFGIIFQQFNLLNYLSVIDNITLSCKFSKKRSENVLKTAHSLDDEAKKLCLELDITPELYKKPIHELSIGQRQRVAIARALIGQPEIIVADEPTSALDTDRKKIFIERLLQQCKKYQTTLVFVSHDLSLAPYFSHTFSLT